MYVKMAEVRDPCEHFQFSNMRVTDKYQKTSTEMIRLADIIGHTTGKPAENYEYKAAIEYCTKGGQDFYSRTHGYPF